LSLLNNLRLPGHAKVKEAEGAPLVTITGLLDSSRLQQSDTLRSTLSPHEHRQ
jgi:hypothetical protein